MAVKRLSLTAAVHRPRPNHFVMSGCLPAMGTHPGSSPSYPAGPRLRGIRHGQVLAVGMAGTR